MTPTYCAAPWRGLHINFRGDVKTCCAGDPNMLGNLNTSSMQTILQGPILRDIRQTIQSGRLHEDYCSNCIKAERYGRSERHWHNDVNRDFDPTTADLDHYQPSIVDIRWNTTCNLSCNYCGEYCSSKWQSIKKGIPIKNGARPYYDQVCDFLAQHSDHIREVALVGGEPLLLPENERLLDVIPRNCIVTIITNTTVDLDRNAIFHRLSQRQRVGWSMSFDNTGERFEYVRHGSDWQTLTQNVVKVQQLMRDQGHWGGIHAVYNIYNCTRLVEFREWIQSMELTVIWQNLFQPEYLDPLQHAPAVRDLAQAEINRLLITCGDYMSTDEHSFFQQALANLQSSTSDGSVYGSQFQQHIHDIENRYHRDQSGRFSQLWPELAFLLNTSL